MLLHRKSETRLVFNLQHLHRPARRHERQLQKKAEARLNANSSKLQASVSKAR
jgi:hypothetical protein